MLLKRSKFCFQDFSVILDPGIKAWYTSQVAKNKIKKSPVKKFVEQVLKMECESKPHCYIVVKEEKPVPVSKIQELEEENTELAMTILEYETQIEVLQMHVQHYDEVFQQNIKLQAEVEIYKSLIEKLNISST